MLGLEFSRRGMVIPNLNGRRGKVCDDSGRLSENLETVTHTPWVPQQGCGTKDLRSDVTARLPAKGEKWS